MCDVPVLYSIELPGSLAIGRRSAYRTQFGLLTHAPYCAPLVEASPDRIVNRSSIVMACLRVSGSARNSGNQRTMGVSTPGMSFRSMAMPTRVEITLFDADLMLASFVALCPRA